MNPIENLILQFEDMCGESDTELGNEARAYYENLLALVERALPYVEDMVGVASESRFLQSEMNYVLERK